MSDLRIKRIAEESYTVEATSPKGKGFLCCAYYDGLLCVAEGTKLAYFNATKGRNGIIGFNSKTEADFANRLAAAARRDGLEVDPIDRHA
jgi:hypothetical protein